ncbi:glycosyl hydrolase [Kribbella kalugense]|uniref:Alpha-L-rhamnosidase-like protein n=1 Tax=Kribbella kalugense TaxID=2512221 RepID=A0A4R7ZVN0_9ACTN|nr:glycosyl hydrolase [Kribbella kalugense]TDW22133.1 alpha-L-rhamnosidase-like protein [Kribbella kalugense]
MATVDDVRRQFRNPPPEGRPMMRWWWFGPSIERDELDRELRAMAAAGLGGVEVSFVYPMGPVTTRFGSPEFLELVGHAARTARSLGLRFDVTLGSGWSYGGPHIGPELAARQLHWDRREIGAAAYDVPVVAAWPGDEFVAAFVGDGSAPSSYVEVPVRDGIIHVPAGGQPREVLIATSRVTGQNVKRAAVGAEGLTLDHYSAAAAEEHIRRVAEPLLLAAGAERLGSVFCDSLEVYGGDWTPAIFDEFAKRRGYELRSRLYELLVDTGDSKQLRIDFGRTLSELYEDNFLKVFQHWASGHGVPFRIQSYGEPPATMSSYRFADNFEGEGWGWTRIPETRWASSAANTYGRSVVSAEVWTWVHSPSFRATPLDLQGEAHEHFLSGVNQLIGHGWPYSPSNGPGLGWIFYAAGALDDRNPWWPTATDLFASLHRLSWLLQQGTPVRPIKIYIPASDAYADPVGPEPGNLYRVVRRLIPESVPRTIREAGLDYDLIDDDAITVVDPADVPLIVVPDGTTLPLETQHWLEAVRTSGGTVVTDVDALADQLPSAPITPQQDVGVVHRRLDDGDFYFVANTGPEPRELTFDEPMERWSAEITAANVITLHPYESAVLVPTTSSTPTASPAQLAEPVPGPWTVAFDNESRPITLPHRWEDDPELATYSGTATYRTELELPDTTDRLLLDFGPGELVPPDSEPYLPPNSYRAMLTPPVGVAAEVWLNDTHCGSFWAPPYQVDLTDAARPGINALRIDVHNTAANALSVYQHLIDAADEVTARFGRRFDLQHIEHATDYLNSGLLAVPKIVRSSKRTG